MLALARARAPPKRARKLTAFSSSSSSWLRFLCSSSVASERERTHKCFPFFFNKALATNENSRRELRVSSCATCERFQTCKRAHTKHASCFEKGQAIQPDTNAHTHRTHYSVSKVVSLSRSLTCASFSSCVLSNARALMIFLRHVSIIATCGRVTCRPPGDDDDETKSKFEEAAVFHQRR